MPRLRSRKVLSLLTLLVLREGRPAARGWVAATLWPDVELGTALSSLRPLVSELRKVLGSEGHRLTSTDRNSVAFDLEGLEVDVLEFDKAVKRGDLQSAMERYSGPLYEDCDEEWVYQERRSRLEAFLSAVVRYGSLAENPATYERAVPLYRRAIAADPLRDAPRRGLMEAHASLGDVNAALQEYREYALLLSRELGLAPESPTTDLYNQLRAGIRKSARSSNESQPTADIPNNLPFRIDALVGREDEQVDALAMVREHRLVTFTGPGGIGKTELAVAVAANVRKAFPDGVWFLALESLTEEEDLFWELAGILGVSSERKRSSRAAVEERLREARALLVLDNCEHLIDSSTKLAEQLLRSCRNLHILATSRRALGTPGETAWPVPPLCYPALSSLPEGRATRLRVASDYDAVRLFVERAKAVLPEFDLDHGNVVSVIEICGLLEGSPLGIELAAARVRSLSIQSLAGSLRMHSLGMLRTKSGDKSSHRHSSLRATLDWSFDLLTSAEQLILGRLAVFLGGWSLEAAEAVVAGDGLDQWSVAELLDSLVDHSLVLYDPRHNRYRFLETVRQYAEEKLSESRERDRLLRNLRRWCEQFVRNHEMLVAGSGYSESVIPLRVEMPNIRIALDSCSEEPRVGLSIVGKLRRYFGYDGMIEPGLALFEEALQCDDSEVPSAERAEALLGLGILAQASGDSDRCRSALEEALKDFKVLDMPAGQAEALDDLAVLERSLGNHAVALDLCERALEISRRIGNKVQLARTAYSYCVLLTNGNDPELLREVSREAVQLQRDLGGTVSVAWPLRTLSMSERWLGNWTAAQKHIEEGLRLLEGTEDLNNLAMMHEFAGRTSYEMGDFPSAEFHYDQSVRTYDQGNFSHWGFLPRLGLAALHIEEDRLEEGKRMMATLSPSILADRAMAALAEESLGVLAMKQGKWDESRAHFQEGMRVSLEAQFLRGLPILLERMSVLSLQGGDPVRAVHCLGAAEESRCRLRLARPPFRSRLIDPVRESCLRSLGSDRFSETLRAGREMDVEAFL